MSSRRTVLREYLEALLIAVIFATFARTWVVQAFKIPTGSMEQNLLVGDHILVNKFILGPTRTLIERWLLPVDSVRRGDVVVFKFPEDPARDFIKRCIGLPGDVIQIVDKVVLVNDEEVDDESYAYRTDSRVFPHSEFLHESFRFRDNFGPFTVPADHYFFLGDNRDNSNDSRFWGPVPASYVKGRALLVYWSFASESGESMRVGWAARGRRAVDVLTRFFTHTRWERSFRLVR